MMSVLVSGRSTLEQRSTPSEPTTDAAPAPTAPAPAPSTSAQATASLVAPSTAPVYAAMAAPVVRLVALDLEATEGADEAMFALEVSKSPYPGGMNVYLQASGVGAQPAVLGLDYNMPVLFDAYSSQFFVQVPQYAGPVTVPVPVTAVQDVAVEETKTFSLTLMSTVEYQVIPFTHVVTIVDDEWRWVAPTGPTSDTTVSVASESKMTAWYGFSDTFQGGSTLMETTWTVMASGYVDARSADTNLQAIQSGLIAALNYAQPTATLPNSTQWVGSKRVYVLDSQTGNIRLVNQDTPVVNAGDELFVRIETRDSMNFQDPNLHTVSVTVNFYYGFVGKTGLEIWGID